MGIQGLLPFLEKASTPTNISQYAGCTVAVDTYCWLHKGAFSCADKLARGEQTDQYIWYCMKFVNMLLSHNIKPILVFDGRHLPAKAETEKVRKERRDLNRKKAAELLRADRVEEARNFIRRCVDVTHEMASALMNKCHANGVDCIVAPYEADAQLAFFNITGVAQLIITEDSDLLLFGCKKVLFKMDLYGNGLLVDQSLLPLAMKQSSDQFSLEKFRYMCILSGCDYLPSLPGIGLAKACKFIKMTADDDICRALNRLGAYLNMKNLVVSQEYKENFLMAVSMFKYQPVYDPFQRRLTTLTPLPEGKPLPVDEGLPPETCFLLALGNLNPFTLKQTNNWDPDNANNSKTVGWNANNKKNSIWSKDYQASKQVVPKVVTASFDKYVTRIDKPKQQTNRKNFIEDATSPKKNNLEDELNNLRNLYSVKSQKKRNCVEVVSGMEVMDENNVDDQIIMLDDLFGDVENDENQKEVKSVGNGHHARNPFHKNTSTSKTASNQMTPLSGTLSKLCKLSTPVNETTGEVSRYFNSSYSVTKIKEESQKETSRQQQSAGSSVNKLESPLKDILNTPTKVQTHNISANELTTPNVNRRNIFSSSPNKKTNNENNVVRKKIISPGRTSFLDMLDTMVSPLSGEDNKRQCNKLPKEVVKTPVIKKQTVLPFNDTSTSTMLTLSARKEDEEIVLGDDVITNRENDDPVQVTAFVKALPTLSVSFQTKVKASPSAIQTTQKKSISHKLGPAKTVGLKRKKSLSNDQYSTKQNQPSIFDMFSFQPKAKLKIQ